MGKKRTHAYEDQFGDSMASQDRDERHTSGKHKGGSGSGGGSAGVSRRGDVSFIRHVPKFLQSHAHYLIGNTGGRSDIDAEEGTMDPAMEVELEKKRRQEDDDDDEEEALKRAIELDPSLAQQYPELMPLANRVKALRLKEKGNKAFSDGNYEEADTIFTDCIQLDSRNEIYWSNKAAALMSMKKYIEAAAAARRVISLKPTWVKGYTRLGMALLAMNDVEAKEVFEEAIKLEPNDEILRSSLATAMQLEEKLKATGQHVFIRKRVEEDGSGRNKGDGIKVGKDLHTKKKQLLSFDGEEDCF